MKAFRLAVCLLAAVLLLSSCGIIVINRGEETKPVTTGTETDFPPLTDTYDSKDYPLVSETDGEAASRDRLDALPTVDLDGLTVFFTVSQETAAVFDEEDDLYRTAVLKRNDMVNKKYNVQIITARMNAAALLDGVAKADKAGDFFSDFAVIRSGDLAGYLTGEYLLNLKSLPFADYSASYYNQAAMEQMTVGGVIYGAAGDATEQIETYGCLYFNKTLAKELGMACPYDAVYDGSFTWESFLASLTVLNDETVRFVSICDDETTAALSFVSSGGHFLAANSKKQLRLACETDEAEAMIDYLKALFAMDTKSISVTVTPPAGTGDETSATAETEELTGFGIFEAGKALYAFGAVGQMESLENAGFVWEVLPMPKMSEEQSYHTPMTADAPIIVALASSQNLDTMGYMLQAVNAASCGYLTHEFYTDAMQRLITGVNTLDMLDIIRENPTYDIAFMLGEDVKAVRTGTYGAFLEAIEGKKSLSSYLDKKESGLNKYLDGLT